MSTLLVVLALGAFLVPSVVRCEPFVSPADMRWDSGAEDCTAHPHAPIESHACDARTFVLREGLCATWEAPFLYLLVGDERALLIDTGDVADPDVMPLARTVLSLVPGEGPAKLPLLVVHTHRHRDHRAGDGQFARSDRAEVVPFDLEQVQQYFGLRDWPNRSATLDLGGRIVDVLPAPGHDATEVVYYDRGTGLLFSGDFILPGRLLVEDLRAYRESARRVADFVRDRRVTWVLGGHIEEDRGGELFGWKSTFHPGERALPLTKAEVLALPEALEDFNGFYGTRRGFVMIDPMRNLTVAAGGAFLVLAAVGYALFRIARRRRRARG